MSNIKNNLKNKFNKEDNYSKIMNTIQNKRIRNKKIIYVSSIFLLIFITGISIVYAKDIKSAIGSVIYKYEKRSSWENKPGFGVDESAKGIYSIKVNERVKINNVDNNLKISSINELEEKLGVKILKNKNIEYKYFNIFNTSSDNSNFNKFIKDPALININISNYENFKCNDFIFNIDTPTPEEKIKDREKCLEDMLQNQPDKRLNISINFATQYATKKQLDEFILYIAEFEENEVEIYNSEKLATKVYISRWNKYIFVYDNIVYIIDNSNNDYFKEELLNEIENMFY